MNLDVSVCNWIAASKVGWAKSQLSYLTFMLLKLSVMNLTLMNNMLRMELSIKNKNTDV